MLCSPAEIEKKRLEALQRLSKKNVSPAKSESLTLEKQTPTVRAVVGCSSPLKNLPGFTFSKRKPYEKTGSATSKTEIQFNGVFYGQNQPVIATISFMSLEKLCVKTSAYSLPVIEALKTVPSKNYEPKDRIWSFHLRDIDDVILKLNMLKSKNITVEQPPSFVVNCIRTPSPILDVDITQIDSKLFQTLLPFQVEGLQFGVRTDGRCMIADDMGLGKTFQALAIMNYYKTDWPLLIVTTASMKNVWEETILKYIPSVSIMQIQYMVAGKDYIGDSLILIVSHDLMSRCCEKLLERNFGCIIIDESHNLKNHKAKMTQAASKLCRCAKRVVLLSGTPALSRPKELYSQLSLIDDKFFGSFFHYAKRYCDMQKTVFGLDSSGQSNLQELEILLKKKFMIRRRKEDVLGSLPNKSQEIVKLNVNRLNSTDKELLETLANQFTRTKRASEKHAILLTFFCETAKIKIPAVCAHVQKVLESNKKFLVFAHHHVILDALEQMLKYKGSKYIRIDGNTSGDQRKYFVDKFQTDENYSCAILSITATNAGITLTAAQQVIFAELHWNPSILNQAEARAHRIGQENAVLVQYLLAGGTADDHIWPLLQEKQNILREMGLTKETYSDVQPNYQDSCKDTQNTIKSMFNKISDGREVMKDQTNEDNAFNDGLDDILCNIDM